MFTINKLWLYFQCIKIRLCKYMITNSWYCYPLPISQKINDFVTLSENILLTTCVDSHPLKNKGKTKWGSSLIHSVKREFIKACESSQLSFATNKIIHVPRYIKLIFWTWLRCANVEHRYAGGVSERVSYKLNNVFKDNATEYRIHT